MVERSGAARFAGRFCSRARVFAVFSMVIRVSSRAAVAEIALDRHRRRDWKAAMIPVGHRVFAKFHPLGTRKKDYLFAF